MSVARPREERTALGLAVMCGAVICFTSIDASAKWLILSGLPALQVVFFRYAGHLLFSFAVFLPSEGLAGFRSGAPRRQLLRSGLLLASTVLNFWALSYLPITVTTAIAFAAPVVVTLLSIPILGEQVSLRRIVAVLVGFGGVLIVMQPWGAAFHPAMLLSLGTLLCASLYFIMTRMLAGTETNATSQIWSSGIATICLAPFVISGWTWPEGNLQIAVSIGIGCLGGLGHTLATTAHRFADASILAPVIYLQLVTASLAGILIFATPPTPWMLAGATVIIGSGIYIWRMERRSEKRPHR